MVGQDEQRDPERRDQRGKLDARGHALRDQRLHATTSGREVLQEDREADPDPAHVRVVGALDGRDPERAEDQRRHDVRARDPEQRGLEEREADCQQDDRDREPKLDDGQRRDVVLHRPARERRARAPQDRGGEDAEESGARSAQRVATVCGSPEYGIETAPRL
jgi:hypothetical protein